MSFKNKYITRNEQDNGWVVSDDACWKDIALWLYFTSNVEIDELDELKYCLKEVEEENGEQS